MKTTIQTMMTMMISKELLAAAVLMLQIHELRVAELLEVWILTEILCLLNHLLWIIGQVPKRASQRSE
jgi:hypothetical protein